MFANVIIKTVHHSDKLINDLVMNLTIFSDLFLISFVLIIISKNVLLCDGLFVITVTSYDKIFWLIIPTFHLEIIDLTMILLIRIILLCL